MATKTDHRVFDSVDELVASALNDQPSEHWKMTRHSLHGSTSQRWTLGVQTPQQAADLALSGWREGYDATQAILTDMEGGKRRQGRAESWTLEPSGHFPDVGAYASGSPWCMHQTVPDGREIPVTVYRMTVHIGVSHFINAEAIVRWGAAICALVRDIERRGDSVELIASMDARSSDGSAHVLRVRIKSAGQPLDIDRAAFAIAHPAMLRRLGFAIREQSDICAKGDWSNYGYSAHVPTAADGVFIANDATNDQTSDEALRKVTALFTAQLEAAK